MNEPPFAFLDPDPHPARPAGALQGLRIALTPDVSVRAWPTDAGSRALENYRAVEDATVVRRLKAQGAQLIGTTRMAELGLGVVSHTAHLALAKGLCDAVLMSDKLGEARYLSALAGAWGYKPSFGVCSRLGMIGLIPSMESIGVIATSPGRLVDLLAGIGGADPDDFSMLWENLPDFAAAGNRDARIRRVGVIREQCDGLDPADRAAFEKALSRLTRKGIEIRPLSLPDLPIFRLVHRVIGATEASSSAGKYDGVRYGHRSADAIDWNDMYLKSRGDSFGPLIKAYLFQGAYFQFDNYAAFEHACRLRRDLVEQGRVLFRDVDTIASPVRRSDCDAARAGTVSDLYEAFDLTLAANVLGSPALSVPDEVLVDDRDLGLQLIGPHLSDESLLALALDGRRNQTRT